MDTKLRDSTSLVVFLLCTYTYINTCVVLTIGYSFPGFANNMSRKLLEKWKQLLSDGLQSKQISRGDLKELEDI